MLLSEELVAPSYDKEVSFFGEEGVEVNCDQEQCCGQDILVFDGNEEQGWDQDLIRNKNMMKMFLSLMTHQVKGNQIMKKLVLVNMKLF